MKKKNITILISALSILAIGTIGIGFAEKKHDKSTVGVDVSIK